MIEIRLLKNEDELKQLIPVFKKAFAKHNMFEQSKEKVFEYLKKAKKEIAQDDGDVIVAVDNGKIIGGLLLVKREKGEDKHSVWRFRHFAVLEKYHGKDIRTGLIQYAESQLKEKIKQGTIKTAKIELHIAENEKETPEYFKKKSYKLEGTLANHYRWGENCYVMGKSIK
ncbi:GNAT family N-acetyltransferase [Candidatus Woesearchaeota archaeon]|nr:GNAT family N-acetyltransferase [Candidatus Woesearchaeota archaeon]